MKTRRIACSVAAVVCLASTLHAQSQLDHPVGTKVGYVLESGPRDNPGDTHRVVFSQVVSVKESAWLRLFFSDLALAPESYLLITSFDDGETQRLDAVSAEIWSNSTAYFNGDTVLLELHAAPRTMGNRVAMERLTAETAIFQGRGSPGQCGICGSDDRTSSAEAWSGRLMPVGCTASLFCEDGTIVSAGHCMQSNMVMQFNVPSTTIGCATRNPPVADQFPVTQIQSQNGGVGADWAVLRTGVNNLNENAYEHQNELRRIATSLATIGQAASIFGYGLDTTCVRSQTQQFSSGTISNRTASTYRFNHDIRGGNSGSAFIVNDRIVGIVTHCNSSCTNIATRHDLTAFTNARNALALCDNTYTISVLSMGAASAPIAVTPPDTAGASDGVTAFSRTYSHFTSVSLTAPDRVGNECFVQWTLNGAPVVGQTLSFTVTGTATAIAFYASCCECDWNTDNTLNSQDFFDFLTDFFNNDADFNASGETNSQDFFDFLTCFFTGC